LALASKYAFKPSESEAWIVKNSLAGQLFTSSRNMTNLITGDIASSNVKAALMDPAYMQKVILELVKSWPANEFLTIQASDSDGLKAYFEANAKGLLEKGYKIEKVSGKKASFSIIPADGSYKVTFGEDEFIEFFKEFLRPQLVEMLF